PARQHRRADPPPTNVPPQIARRRERDREGPDQLHATSLTPPPGRSSGRTSGSGCKASTDATSDPARTHDAPGTVAPHGHSQEDFPAAASSASPPRRPHRRAPRATTP